MFHREIAINPKDQIKIPMPKDITNPSWLNSNIIKFCLQDCWCQFQLKYASNNWKFEKQHAHSSDGAVNIFYWNMNIKWCIYPREMKCNCQE